MGSGELTATMVEVHKELVGRQVHAPQAVFLDTPAGFQLNADQLSKRAVEYFRTKIQHDMQLASFKSKEGCAKFEAKQALTKLRHADFIFIGPGSPTYAIRQWQDTPIPEIITRQVEKGGCLVAASAAALTVGRFTLPVYEIYKVGEDLHWVEGINILGQFGFNLVVIPHWNNAEGGTHDTRFCFMGKSRFSKLESMLPEDVSVFGLDEHTACLIDLEKDEAVIKGLGSVTLRRKGEEIFFEKGDQLSLEILRGGTVGKGKRAKVLRPKSARQAPDSEEKSFWDRIHGLEKAFHIGLQMHDFKKTTNALLEIDWNIWKAKEELENEEFITQAREVLRELIVLLGMELMSFPRDKTECLAPIIKELLSLRQRFRDSKKWEEADAIRESLGRGNIKIEDTQEGSRWQLMS